MLKYLGRFLLILLIQLLVVNNIELSTYVNAYVYILFILSLPITLKPWLVVIVSFLTGMAMDTFSSTPGLHMAACGFMGYIRNLYLQFTCSKEDFDGRIEPSISTKGFGWFLIYVITMTMLHHLVLFYLEIYSFGEFFRTFLRVVGSSGLTVVIILIGQLLFYRTKRTR